jgi:hypothetical protein
VVVREVGLFLIFAPALGLPFALVASRGIRATFRYVIVKRKLRWVSRAEVVPGRFVRLLSASANVFTTAGGGAISPPGILGCIGCLGGVALGAFGDFTIVRITLPILIAMGAIITTGIIRLVVVPYLQMIYQRTHARIARRVAQGEIEL